MLGPEEEEGGTEDKWLVGQFLEGKGWFLLVLKGKGKCDFEAET